MKMHNPGFVFGGISGFLAVAFAAYAAHGLRGTLPERDFENITEALNYQLLHSAAIAMIGMAQSMPLAKPIAKRLGIAGIFYGIGIICFCGGILVGTLTNMHEALRLAPIGGSSFMLGWLMLASAGFIKRS